MAENNSENIAQVMMELLKERGVNKSICPSEVAKNCFEEDWREKMEAVREVARKLEEEGKAVITQKGKKVNLSKIKGPIRITLANA